MNFWKNSTLDKLEKGATGDAMRALPRNDFPWTIDAQEFSDSEGDSWQLSILCNDIVPAKNNKLVVVSISVEATCRVKDTNLERMGLAPGRLYNMLNESPSIFKEHMNKNYEMPMEEMEGFCKKLCQAVRANLLLRHTFNSKQKIIWQRIRSAPLSRFSEID
jgi:hypothetical protein